VLAKSQGKTAELDSLFEQIARKYGEHALKDSTVRKTKGRDAVIASCAAVDKMRLLREQSTSIRSTEGNIGCPIQVIVVPAATDPGGRCYTPAELKELVARPTEIIEAGPVASEPVPDPPDGSAEAT
jgi:hypothetical protein